MAGERARSGVERDEAARARRKPPHAGSASSAEQQILSLHAAAGNAAVTKLMRAGANELEFEDTAGSEEIGINAGSGKAEPRYSPPERRRSPFFSTGGGGTRIPSTATSPGGGTANDIVFGGESGREETFFNSKVEPSDLSGKAGEPTQQRQTLRRGSTGPLVAQLQAYLNGTTHDLRVDGIFGPKTARAVRAFQRAAVLPPDGVVGPDTWAFIESGVVLGQFDRTGSGPGGGGHNEIRMGNQGGSQGFHIPSSKG